MNKNSLILVDRLIDKNEDAGFIVAWSDIVVPKGIISLPIKTDEDAGRLKAEFLKWHHDFGQAKVNDQSLVSYLKIFDNLSFWWLTSIAEKSPFLCDSIFQVFKLLTLEKFYLEMRCESLVYLGDKKPIHSVLKNWIQKLGHSYKWIPCSFDRSTRSSENYKKKLIRKSPYILQGMAWLLKRWLSRWQHIKPMLATDENPCPIRPTIITFFPNIHMDQAEKGRFRSKYWERLHDYFETKKIPIDWVWFYFDSKDFSFKDSIEFKNECNLKSNTDHKYFLLEEFLNFKGLLKSLLFYFRLRRKANYLNHLHKNFCFSNSKINFFPILENDWNHSFFGIGAIEKITWAIMFDTMSQKLQASPWALFTWENQSWEKALVSGLKRYRPKSKVFGYEHSSIRLMDLRLFADPRAYEENEKKVEQLPIPDMLGINSSIGLKWIRESGYPAHKTIRIEALRYFNLKGKYACFKKTLVTSNRKLLLVAGIIPEEVRFQLKLLKQAAAKGGLEKYNEVWIKPHPGLVLDGILRELDLNFKFTIFNRPIIELMKETDVVYCSNSTGTSLEAAWLGVPLVILAAKDSMNLNPLFGFSGLHFVKDYSDLIYTLNNPKVVQIPKDYFFLDENLNSWKDILQL